MRVIYEPHPVTPERKKELRAQGYKIIDAAFAPADYVHPDRASEKRAKEMAEAAAKKALAENGRGDAGEQGSGAGDGLDDLDAEQLHALAKERGIKVHHASGADKVREALREAAAN